MIIASRLYSTRTFALMLFPMLAAPAFAFDLEGHRGTRGNAPENTLAAFRRAIEIGVTTIETDMGVTKDDVVVISHNPDLSPDLVRDPDGHWLASRGPQIHSLTFAELRRYDIGRINPMSQYAKQFPNQRASDGERFPKLSELFDLGKASGKPVRFNIETKITPTSGANTPDPATFANLVIAVVRESNVADRVTVQSFDWRTLIEVKRIAPEIETSCLTIQTPNDDTVSRARWRRIAVARGPRAARLRRLDVGAGEGGGLRNLVDVLAQPDTEGRRRRARDRDQGPAVDRQRAAATCATSSTWASTASSPTTPIACAR